MTFTFRSAAAAANDSAGDRDELDRITASAMPLVSPMNRRPSDWKFTQIADGDTPRRWQMEDAACTGCEYQTAHCRGAGTVSACALEGS